MRLRGIFRSSSYPAILYPAILYLAIFAGPGIGLALPSPLGSTFSGDSLRDREPLAIAAEYYFARHDFRQALPLWSEVWRRRPESSDAAFRVAELRLMYEGRAAAKTALVRYIETLARTSEARKAAEDKLTQLQSTFLTDEGQSLFFQAIPKARRGDCQPAIAQLTQAATLERGNLRVLLEKARCEKSLGWNERGYESLQQAFDQHPYLSETIDNLAETHLFFHAPAKAVEIFRRPGFAPRSLRQRIAFGVALAESDADAEAIAWLQALVAQDKLHSLHPIVYWTLGRLLSSRGNSAAESLGHLDMFLSASGRPETTLIEGWDPYRSSEHFEPAKKLVAQLSGGPR